MAITSSDTSCDNKVPSKSSGYSSKHSCRLLKLNFGPDSSVSSATSKCSKPKISNSKCRSPYITGDRIQLLSRVVEKRFVHKTGIVSSFPLAARLYKTNSGDFKSPKKATKKVKKSVLTLPNDPAPVPQACTVSDINESEYCDKNDEDRKRKVVKKRAPTQNIRKARVREKDFEFYDRDAEYCSQLNIDLDCSSTDMMKNFNGDSKRMSNRKKILPINSNKTHTASNNLNDVWAVLRNINRFQFRPSPALSEESIPPVKRKIQKRPKNANRKDARVIETCRTQEFAYISSYELDKKSASNFSPSSSIDRITVIDNKDEFDIICKEFEKRLLQTHDFLKDSNNSKNLIQKNKILAKSPKKNVPALGNSGAKDNKQLTPLKKKKKINLRPPVVEQSKSEMTDISNGNRDSLIGTDTLQYNGISDSLLNKTENCSMISAKVSYIGSDNSGSSKAELPNEQISRYDKSLDVAVLNKEQEATANIPILLDPQQRKPRLVTTMPSSCMIPKLTQTEIKRRLAHMRFPIVVLGKDQVSSSIQVMDYDPPQFNGLDHHIWPFMIEWSPNAPKDTKNHNNTLSRKCLSYLLDSNSASKIKSKSRKTNTEVGICKQAAFKDKKQESTTLKKKAIITPTPPSEITDKLTQCSKKQKSIVQLKDKMLNFLYKKSSNRDVNNYSYENDESKPITLNDNSAKAENTVTTITDIQLKPDNVLILNNRPIERPFSSVEGDNKKAPIYKYPWAKAKWASDFIDNVMKKIRNGVYYSQDLKDFCDTRKIDLQEVSIQAESYTNRSINNTAVSTQTCVSEADSTHDETNDINQNNRISIPGFDNTLPSLEIQSLNMNQIAVKHCMTNIMVQFDVTVPAKTDKSTRGLNKTLSLTPIAITKSQTKVYKCKTTIFNAMLPAELCSIVPEMMSSLVDSNNSMMESPALCLTKTDSWLSTITELTRYENDSTISTSPDIKRILEGRFSTIDYKNPRFKQIDFKIKYDQCLVTDMLPMVSLNNLLKYKASALVVELDNSQYKHSQASSHQLNKEISGVTDTPNHTISTAVQIYTGSKKRLTVAFKPNQLVGMIESIMRSHNLQINQNLNSYFDMLKLQYNGKNVEINMSIINDSGVQKNISVTVSNLNIDSLYEAIPKINNDRKYQMNGNNTPLQCIGCINTSLARKSQNKELTQVTHTKAKRKGFYKIYRKCKSTNKPRSRKKLTDTANTPLSKIKTIDDFFQILGSKKIFSSVFDGNAAKNILSSLMEMKNWISEINPKQALLVLLLTNKKDTPNLVRFRPIILQGIAVNRITLASELDMEIEVIAREKLKPFQQQFEGITYLSESVTDYENLLDELYWIAKNTASDYNKPFDESSVRLLKSLLQKRKKLNPSYLRVMARYVGLGLVKTPTC